MRGQSLTRRIAVGVAIATVCFIALSTAVIGGLEWEKLQRRIDDTMSFQTRDVLSRLQMLHEAVTVSIRSQLKMLKSLFPYGTRVELDAKQTTEMGPTKMKVPIFRLGGIEMNERFIEVYSKYWQELSSSLGSARDWDVFLTETLGPLEEAFPGDPDLAVLRARGEETKAKAQAQASVALGITTGLQFLPILLLSPYAGLVADRMSKRTLLQFTQAWMAVWSARESARDAVPLM